MYELVLKAEGYNKITFRFDDLKELTEFAKCALEHGAADAEATIRMAAEEGEEEC